jgi:hypothetical protein
MQNLTNSSCSFLDSSSEVLGRLQIYGQISRVHPSWLYHLLLSTTLQCISETKFSGAHHKFRHGVI